MTTTGTTYVNIGGNQEYDGNYRGQLDRLDDAYTTSPKGIKVGIKATESSTGLPVGDIQISGGNIHVTCSGQQDGSEGIESKGTLTISGNDGLDSNGNLYFSGGTTVAYGTRSPECGIDANEEEGYTVFFTGGNVLGIGGGNNSHPTTQESTQGYVTYSGNVTADCTLTVSKDGTVLATFTLPYDYSRGNVILTAEGMTAGEQYTVSDGTSTQTLSAWGRQWTRWRRRSWWWRPRRLVNHRDHIAHRNGNPRESQSTTVYNPQSTKRPFRNDLLRKGRFTFIY